MMTPAQQHRSLGASASASDDLVIVQVGTQSTAMRPSEARTFTRCLVREIFRAEIVAFHRELQKEGAPCS